MPLSEQEVALRAGLLVKMREKAEQHAAMMQYKVQSRDVTCLLKSYYRVDGFQFGRLTLYIPKVRKIGNRLDRMTAIGTVSTVVYPLQRMEIDICTDIITMIANALEPEGLKVKRLGTLSNPVLYLEYSIMPVEWIERAGAHGGIR